MSATLAVLGATTYGVHQGYAADAGIRAANDEPAPTWAIAPQAAGPDLPPAGRSLFDTVVAGARQGKPGYDIPFPLPALLRRIEERAGCPPAEISDAKSCVQAVLIPLGRSLQRPAAAPDFFAYPRVVAAVTGEPATRGQDRSTTRMPARPLLKDRIYLGYQERANLIEVISYNDAAGRFEFQLVKDYATGRRPRVVYANRLLCTTCHQNHAPIFSRPLWQETNANPAVAARLKASRRNFYGLKIERGVDIPNAIDNATERANLFAAAQTLWRDGCTDPADTSATGPVAAIRCRAALLKAALQYRLSGERGFADSDELARFAARAARRWHNGLAIGNPDIPNRDPLAVAAPRGATLAAAHVPARFDPLLRRPPLEVWYPIQTDFARRAVVGLAAFFAEADVDALDARLADRDAIAAALDDLIAANANGKSDALGDQPFRRDVILSELLSRLGIDYRPCCADERHLPPPQVDDISDVASAAPAPAGEETRGFFAYCAGCHRSREAFPPNFLHGSASQVAANLRQCAERIYFRLSMWQVTETERPKTPMPPALALDRLKWSSAQWATSPDLAAMTRDIAEVLRADGRPVPTAAQMLVKDYETLTPCVTGR